MVNETATNPSVGERLRSALLDMLPLERVQSEPIFERTPILDRTEKTERARPLRQ